MDGHGHTELELETPQAITRLETEQQEGNWIYLGDKLVDEGTKINNAMLENVQEITVTPPMIGG